MKFACVITIILLSILLLAQVEESEGSLSPSKKDSVDCLDSGMPCRDQLGITRSEIADVAQHLAEIIEDKW